jgi:hypothetical protein
MGLPNIELYEALKKTPVGEEAARMIAAVVPAAENVATRLDIAAVKLDIARLENQLTESETSLKAEIYASSVRNIRWMLAFFIPVWAGTWGTVVAILLKG